MVPNLITFRHTAQSLVAECFAATPEFAASINQAFEFFVNKRENKPAEMMGAFLFTDLFLFFLCPTPCEMLGRD